MPKVLIREYDNSTTGIPASDNFAVVVPGYFGASAPTVTKPDGTTEYLADTKLWNSDGVYELKSQSDFIKYVGREASTVKAAKAPRLHIVNHEDDANDYTKHLMTLEPSDFDTYFDKDNKDHFYKVVVVSSVDDRYGKNGYLYTTINYVPLVQREQEVEDADGISTVQVWVKPEIGDDDYKEESITLEFTRITSLNAVEWDEVDSGETDDDGNPIMKIVSKTNSYCVISEGDEGSNEVQDPQMGNQIAYELLGLGYTVLYKKLDENIADQKVQMLNDQRFWEPLKDKSVFNFRYVMTGGYYAASAMNRICELAAFRNDVKLEEAETYGNQSGRGDCIALCDIDETIPGKKISSNLTVREIIENMGYAANLITKTNEYSAIFAPKVTYIMDDLEVEKWDYNKTFPASFHYLACAARTFERYNEWYAVAGYNRGVSNYSIANTSVKLGEIAINTLAPRVENSNLNIQKSINLILYERGSYYLWGNRTAYRLDNRGIVFHHFLNIRQLCCSIKKQLYTACRQFTFDPNSDLLWINFVNAIKPTLEAMKADQGIKGYTISRVANDKKALLTARIRIVPIEAVEDFDISIYLEDSLTGIVVSADETQA
jgi:hypothetical protein